MNETASGQELAAILGVSTRTITDYASAGICVRIARGRYDVRASIPRVVAHLRDTASGRSPGPGDELQSHKIRIAKAQADRAEREAQAATGKLINADEAEREWGDMCALFMRTMMGLPSAIAGVLPHLTRHETTIIEDKVRDALNRCADAAQQAGDAAAASAITPTAATAT